jgi:hypothetical protein
MTEISRLNLEYYKLCTPDGLSHRTHLGQCNTIYSRQGEISNHSIGTPQSAHQRLQAYSLEKQRDELIKSFAEKLLTEVSGLYAGYSSLIMVFGLTEAGNPSIEIKFEGIPLHKRGVMSRHLASKIKVLADCLDYGPGIPGPVRNYAIGYTDRIPATSPEDAIWKWLCLRHRELAEDIAKREPGDDLVIPNNGPLQSILNSATLHEIHDTRKSLAGARGLIWPAST